MTTPMESTFASRIRQYRQERGLSQAALAELCDLTQGNIAHMENGTEPKQSNVSKLIAGLPDLNPDWLLTGTGPMLRDGRALSPAPVERPATTAAAGTKSGPMLTPEQAAEVLIELANAKGHIARLESAVEYQEEIIADLRADKALLQRAHFGYAPPATDAPQSDAPESLPGKVESDSYAAGQERKYIGGQHRDPETGNVLLFSINPGLMAEQAAHLVRGARHFALPLPDSATGPESTVKQA